MDEFGDWLMMFGFVVMGIGGLGLTAAEIFTAFTVSLPTGIIAVTVSGFLWAIIGSMISS